MFNYYNDIVIQGYRFTQVKYLTFSESLLYDTCNFVININMYVQEVCVIQGNTVYTMQINLHKANQTVSGLIFPVQIGLCQVSGKYVSSKLICVKQIILSK